MKKIFFVLAALCVFTACRDKDEEEPSVGYIPECYVSFYISGTDGSDLLNPNNLDAFKDGEVALTYNNWSTGQKETTYIGAYSEESSTNEPLMYTFNQPYVVLYPPPGRYLVNIGDFHHHGHDVVDERINIRWPDGLQDVIHLNYRQSYNKKTGGYTVDLRIMLNDKQVDLDRYSCFTIVKKRS